VRRNRERDKIGERERGLERGDKRQKGGREERVAT